ncbi:four and a half LIM domains protein 2-like [Watersipora subatra]|uniref:four and a half LIM domains protein 2-like n=1 Tax=Watersipora subatra TaxID=2589382 RepID=UPI00355C14DF
MEYCNCSQCETPLTGKRYVLRQDQPTCLPCYEDKFANKCEKCEKAIGTDFKDLSYKGRHWHEACFLCWGCQNSLANQQFVAKDTGLYCPDCYDGKFAQRCDCCSNTFKHGMQKFEYSGKKFHHECFTCSECSEPIGNNSFVPKDEGKLVCMPCYNEKFAQKCAKCNEVLLQGGVTFRENAFHRECFLCTGCDTELANVKFATKDDQPYCPDCYIKTFAKICEKCDQPIAGLGQATKYVAFEGRQWHADCFICQKCEKSLLGQGFLVCEGQVVCPDCGKNM